MSFDQGESVLSDWYENRDGQPRRDFVLRDFDNWIWHVKQYANPGTTTVTEHVAYQSNPQTGETVKLDIDYLCTKAIGPEVYKELQFTHACKCCDHKW